ncbi:unnamed protein product [Durusdinium trenchii]|uniref:Bacteriophage T5 Orf172 DNA-binding domain-containing protein n=1 Tax=Durusdinium trenchii TaxID=1381693 RepID=A0ABP0RM55_9DINO
MARRRSISFLPVLALALALLHTANVPPPEVLLGQRCVNNLETWRRCGDVAMVRGGLRTLSQRGLIYLLCLRYPTDGQVGRSPYYKIGGTRDMGQRLQAYVTSQPFAPEVIKTVVVPDWRTAEAQILKAFPKPDDLDGGKEWRRFSPQEVQKVVAEMDAFSSLWELLPEEAVSLHAAQKLLNTEMRVASSTPYNFYDLIPNDLESIHQYAAHAVLHQFSQQEQPRAAVIMPEHTGLTKVGIEVVKAMLRRDDKIQRVLVVMDHLQLAGGLDQWSELRDVLGVNPICVVDRHRSGRVYAADWAISAGLEIAGRQVQIIDSLNSDQRQVFLLPFTRYSRLKSALDQVKNVSKKTFDLVIWESSLSTTMAWSRSRGGSKLEKKPFQEWFDDDCISARHRLFLSSSTVSFRFAQFTGLFEIAAMQPFVAKYGAIAFHLPRSAAVQRGLLRPIKVLHSSSLSLNCVNHNEFKSQAEAVQLFMSQYTPNRVYAFVAKRLAAEKLQAEFDAMSPNESRLKYVSILSNMSIEERVDRCSQIFAAEEPGVVISVKVILRNRSSLPADAALWSASKTSSIDCGYMLGLLSKPFPGSLGQGVVLTVGDSAEDTTQRSQSTFVIVMATLAADDPFIINSLKKLVVLCVAQGRDLPLEEWPNELQALMECDCTMPRQVLAQVYELASLSLPDHDAQDWNFKAELLSAVRVRDGDVDLSLSHKEAGVALGLWLQEQRSAAQEGRLEVQRFERLVDLGVRFDEGRKTKETKTELEWQKRYRQLLGFRLREGDSDVEGLSSWVKLQRRRCKAEKLPKSQKTLLEQLGLDMAMKTRKEESQKKISALKAFVQREGHADVPSSHEEGDVKLGSWISHVRSRYKANLLDKDLAQQLRELGLSLEMKSLQWNDYISALDTYADREGHVDVPLDHVEGNLALGRWLESQRSRSLHGGLDPKAKAELEKRGVNMDSVAACWFWNYRLLERFVKTEGHTQVPENDDLKRWIYTQQLKFRDGKLSLDKIHALQKLGVELEEKLPIGGENAKESAEKIKKEQKLSKVNKKAKK